MDALTALADPTRRELVALLAGGELAAGALAERFPVSRPAISRHLRVLREAGLIAERPVPEDKRVRLYALEPSALERLSDWSAGLSRAWQTQLDSFKDYVAVRAAGRSSS